ncbi:hypothetical protein HN801_01320 [Candidatus Peregrinibacteria bacterium]|jgi:hypothetical protein|nr:hypothetical protein [Candidatus Peregrinibacteria bacterium]
MTDNSTANTGSDLSISDETRASFPELVDMIVDSESMNNEERQYWVNILPIMTPEQIQSLLDILNNEKAQLDAIDKKYAKPLSAEEEQEQILKTEAQIQEKREERTEQEEAFEIEDEEASDDLLEKISDL